MKKIAIISGAGISADSGLNTFRDSGGLWEGHRVEDVATPEAFTRNPQLVIDFYNQRRAQLKEVSPNAAHNAISELSKHYHVDVITQNVDDLHERAGNPNVIHLHGELLKLRSSYDPNYIIDFDGMQSLNDKDPNGYPMRPHIVWFGENVPMIGVAAEKVAMADIIIIVGTSLQVYPAAGLIYHAKADALVYLVDPKPPRDLTDVEVIAAKAKDGLPQLVERLLKQS